MLSRVTFPIGELLKTQVRSEAERFGLSVAAKPDSQGLCFVGAVSMPDFLSRYITMKRRPVIDETGLRIGTHHGTALYTIGQRHGFEVEGSATSRGPFYVVGVEVAANTLRVSSRREDAERTSVALSDEHWINEKPDFPARFEAQARYHEKVVGVTLTREGGVLAAEFDEPHLVARGQSMVLYSGGEIIGGALIAS